MVPSRAAFRTDSIAGGSAFAALGVNSGDGVELTDDGLLRATYGRFRVETLLDNVDHTEVTGPHRWYTAGIAG